MLKRGLDSQKIQIKNEKEIHERIQTKTERDKLEKEQELSDAVIKASRLEERVESMQ